MHSAQLLVHVSSARGDLLESELTRHVESLAIDLTTMFVTQTSRLEFGVSSAMKCFAALVCAITACAISACEGTAPARDASQLDDARLTREELRDPDSCKDCHPKHYREWSSSMHAYSAKDPVFIAMNERGQRETNGELGDFCVRCHAPMAVIDGLTTDGLNLHELADKDRGVSCYFCHNVVSIEGDHNAMLTIANDTTMRGGVREPLQPSAHHAEYSPLFENTDRRASAVCGGCHDIVTPNGVHLERTFAEYLASFSAQSSSPDAPPFDSCLGCHMNARLEPAAVYEGAVDREVHEHLWPGVDVALTDFPNRDAMHSAIEDCQLGQSSITFFTLEVAPPDMFTFALETNAGHKQPSGSTQDRRMWLEVLAYDASGALMEELSSGDIADGAIEEHPPEHAEHDPHLWMFRDRLFDARGEPVHMFWQAAASSAYPSGYESGAVPGRVTLVPGENATRKTYRLSDGAGLPARVTARLRMRPIGMDVLQDLVDSGDLDPSIPAQMPTFTFGAQIEWKAEDGFTLLTATTTTDCQSYKCMLHPGGRGCE